MNRRQLLALSLFAVFTCGCATPQRGPKSSVDIPQKYSRIAIACVDIRTSGEAYDMHRKVARADREPEIARIVSNRARTELAARGFTVAESRPVFRFSGSNAIEPLSPAWRPFLTAAETKAFEKRESADAVNDRLELDAKSLFQTQPDADAWLLLFTEAHFQEDYVVPRPRERNAGAKTAGAAAGSVILSILVGAPVAIPAGGGSGGPKLPSWTRHAFVLVDPATGQILWSRWQKFDNEDPRSDKDIEGTARKLFSSLPAPR